MKLVRPAKFTPLCLIIGTGFGPVAMAEPISRGNMAAYCRGEVSAMYATKPRYVYTGQIEEAADGGLSIDGLVDKGNEGIKKFKCRFDNKRNFIDVMAMTSDGAL